MADDLGHLAADSTGKAADSTGKAADSTGKRADSTGKRADSTGKTDADKMREDDSLRELALPVARSRRARASDVRAVITRLCAGRFLTAEQLSGLLRRNQAHLREAYLGPMVSEGLLELRYPAATNRPDQAYTAAGEQ